MKDMFGDTRAIVEPAGALGVAGMKAYLKMHKLTGKTCVAICSGVRHLINAYLCKKRQICGLIDLDS